MLRSPNQARYAPSTAVLEKNYEVAEKDLSAVLASLVTIDQNPNLIKDTISLIKNRVRDYESANAALTKRKEEVGSTAEAVELKSLCLKIVHGDSYNGVTVLNERLKGLGYEACSSLHYQAAGGSAPTGRNEDLGDFTEEADKTNPQEFEGAEIGDKMTIGKRTVSVPDLTRVSTQVEHGTVTGYPPLPAANPGKVQITSRTLHGQYPPCQQNPPYPQATPAQRSEFAPLFQPVSHLPRREPRPEYGRDDNCPVRANQLGNSHHRGYVNVEPPNHEYCMTTLDAFARQQLRADLIRGMGEPFKGDVISFWPWKQHITNRMNEINASPSDEVEILKANTRGKPLEIIREFVILGVDSSDSIVAKIWADFERRFGSEAKLSNHLFGTLESFPKIKSASQIDQLERLLSIGRNMKAGAIRFSSLKMMDYALGQKLIWNKMPDKFITRWQRKTAGKTNIFELQDLLKEIELFIEENSDPLFTNTSTSHRTLVTAVSSNHQFPATPSTSAAQPNVASRPYEPKAEMARMNRFPESQPPLRIEPCVLHPEYRPHQLKDCRVFQNMSVEKRFEVVNKHRLCYICLDAHYAVECPTKLRCQVCGKRHETLLHRPQQNYNPQNTRLNDQRMGNRYDNRSDPAPPNTNKQPRTLLTKPSPLMEIPTQPPFTTVRPWNGNAQGQTQERPSDTPNWRDPPVEFPHDRSRPPNQALNPYDPNTIPNPPNEAMVNQPMTDLDHRVMRTTFQGQKRGTCSKTIPVVLRANNGHEVSVFAIIDEQSTQTFLDNELLAQLGITESNCEKSNYTMSTLAQVSSQFSGARLTGLKVRGLCRDNWIELPPVLTHPGLPDTRDEACDPETVLQFDHIEKYAKFFPELDYKLPVAILIGTDCGEAMKTTCHGDTFPFVHDTPLGWALVGPVKRCPIDSPKPVVLQTKCSSDVTSASLSDPPCHLEHVSSVRLLFPSQTDVFTRVPGDDELDISADDKEFLRLVSDSTKVNKEGNLELPLPLKEDVPLPKNKLPIFMRARTMLNKVTKNPELSYHCQEIMKSYLELGQVEQLDEPINPTTQKDTENYLPVFPVPNKDKIRLVFDSSAKYYGRSFNDCLYRGPDTMNKLLGVLCRFRNEEVGYAADIEKMFHAFHVPPSQRDVLRFFWWDNNKPGAELKIYRAKVHIFGNCCSPAIATLGLRKTTEDEYAKGFPEACSYIRENFYVDDGLGSSVSVDSAVKVITDTRTLLMRYNIRLHKIKSNQRSVLEAFPPTEVAENVRQVDLASLTPQNTLGVAWNLDEDTISLKYRLDQVQYSRRGLLSRISSVYDPIGLIAPVLLSGRLLQREVLTTEAAKDGNSPEWDTPLPEQWRDKWNAWEDGLTEGLDIAIPRCHHPPGFGKIARSELHVFCDASEKAIGFVVYLRQTNLKGEVSVSFIFGTSKVAPRAATSIPRLELCAAVEGARTAAKIKAEMSIEICKVVCYSDSQIVLGYLTNTSRAFQRYITTRVSLVLKSIPAENWRYIPGAENPADIATRPLKSAALKKTPWTVGPEFLRATDDSFPVTDPSSPPVAFSGKLPEEAPVTSTTVNVLVSKIQELDTIRSCSQRYESWWKVVRHTSLVIEVAAKFKKETLTRSESTKKATDLLIQQAQLEYFGDTIKTLKEGSPLLSSDPLLPLDPFLDEDGTLRVGGRLRRAPLPFEERHPVLLPPKHPITLKIWSLCHRQAKHQGRHITNAFLRQRGYFILKGKTVISRWFKNCVLCQRMRGRTQTQKMADLPIDRLETVAPFTNTGVDVFGPFTVHDGVSTRRSKATKKVWILLCVCLVSRAVHLELLGSLDTNALQLALRRFQAIRGPCKLIRSDHGTNFLGALNQNENTMKLGDVKVGAEANGCRWEMTPPYASHFAGVWERKVSAVKSVLYNVIAMNPSVHFSREEFGTWLQEAASIVNSTPYAEVSEDPNDPLPISPQNLLTLRESNDSNLEKVDPGDVHAYGRLRWKRVQVLADEFWRKWKADYLQNLQSRNKWHRPSPNLKVDDVVLLRQESPRLCWPMGRVTEVTTDKDGLVRRVKVMSSLGRNDTPKLFERAIHHLVRLV